MNWILAWSVTRISRGVSFRLDSVSYLPLSFEIRICLYDCFVCLEIGVIQTSVKQKFNENATTTRLFFIQGFNAITW